jgi:exonuclease III
MTLPRAQNLKILTWNADGYCTKIRELQEMTVRSCFEIILVLETHFNQCDKYTLPNYSLYRKDRLNSGLGGVVLFIKKPHLALSSQIPKTLPS